MPATTEMPAPLPDVRCCMGNVDADCICGASERVLRAGVSLTPEQREWCLSEIGQVEGWDRRDFERESDEMLCRTVLDAWTDYCRDKGLM